MTKKDYIKIAETIKDCATFMGSAEVIQSDLINALCLTFKDDNPLFDREKFITYIYR